jgi:hypothetical protein
LQLYVDLDGVLFDFDKAAGAALRTDNIYKYEFVWGAKKFWDGLNDNSSFFRDLPLMFDAYHLWTQINHLDPIILTALPSTGADRVCAQKREAVAENFGSDVRVITCATKEKPEYCQPGDIIIDDRATNRDAWMERGGIYLLHTSAVNTITALEALGII